jgi:hypothetical protein
MKDDDHERKASCQAEGSGEVLHRAPSGGRPGAAGRRAGWCAQCHRRAAG